MVWMSLNFAFGEIVDGILAALPRWIARLIRCIKQVVSLPSPEDARESFFAKGSVPIVSTLLSTAKGQKMYCAVTCDGSPAYTSLFRPSDLSAAAPGRAG
jgi:hypothetical protein